MFSKLMSVTQRSYPQAILFILAVLLSYLSVLVHELLYWCRVVSQELQGKEIKRLLSGYEVLTTVPDTQK